MAVEALLKSLEYLAVPLTDRRSVNYSADEDSIRDGSSGFSRASQVLDAISSPRTSIAEFDSDGNRFFVGVHPVRGKYRQFVLVAFGYGREKDHRILGALRLMPKGRTEHDEFLRSPALAMATILDRYGVEYEVEGGQRTVFTPRVVFDESRFVLHEAVHRDEVLEALGLEGATDDYWMTANMRITDTGALELAFPIVLQLSSYIADTET